MSDKELKKAIDSIQPGSCFGHYEKTARECKTCFVVEQCSKNTASKNLVDASDEEERTEKKKTTPVKRKYTKKKEEPKVEVKEEPKVEVKEEPKVEVKEEPKAEVKEEPKAEVKEGNELSDDLILLDSTVIEVGKSVEVSGKVDNNKMIVHYFDENKMFVAYMKSTGNIQLSKDGKKISYSKLQNVSDAKVLKEDMLVGYEN